MNEDIASTAESVQQTDSINLFQPDFPIAIVDDSEINRLLLKAQLENYSDDITLAKDDQQILYLLKQKTFKLILLDLSPPYLDSLNLVAEIKQRNAVAAQIFIIAITTYNQKHQRKKLIEAGFNACLTRPVLIEQLDHMLNKLLSINSNHSNTYKQSSENSIIFIEQMLKKTDHNKDLALILFNKLFKELPEQIDMLGYALAHRETTLAREITHKLHGSVSFCGFIDIQQTANQLESDLLNNNASSSSLSFQDLKLQIEHFLSFKELILQNL